MPTTITGADNTALNTSLSGPADGETMEASDVNTPFQKVLDNSLKIAKYVVADFTALSAISAPVNGERFYVQGYGFYEYRAASVSAVSSPWIINGPSSVGRYHHELDNIRPANRIIEVYHEGSDADTGLDTTTNTSYEDVNAGIGSSGIITLASTTVAGDIILVDAKARLYSATAATAQVKMQYSEAGGAWADLLGANAYAELDGADVLTVPFALNSKRTVGTGGSFRLKFQFKASAADTIGIGGAYSVRVQVIRP